MYSENDWRYYSELYHHGIMGQQWGVQNGPPYPLNQNKHSQSEKKANWEQSLNNSVQQDKLAIKRINNSSSVNYNKWGKNKDSNVLYVTGLSGSGKSTAAMYLAKRNKAKYINLDSYLSPMSEESKNELQNKEFNNYLSKRVPNYKNVIKSNDKLDFKIVDEMANAIEEYGRQQYSNGNRVVVEGIQLYDNTLFADNKSFAGKPVMVVNTNPIASNYRGSIRDSENILDTVDLMATRLGYTQQSYNQLKKFKRELGM